jgi:hypothetical protein
VASCAFGLHKEDLLSPQFRFGCHFLIQLAIEQLMVVHHGDDPVLRDIAKIRPGCQIYGCRKVGQDRMDTISPVGLNKAASNQFKMIFVVAYLPPDVALLFHLPWGRHFTCLPG